MSQILAAEEIKRWREKNRQQKAWWRWLFCQNYEQDFIPDLLVQQRFHETRYKCVVWSEMHWIDIKWLTVLLSPVRGHISKSRIIKEHDFFLVWLFENGWWHMSFWWWKNSYKLIIKCSLSKHLNLEVLLSSVLYIHIGCNCQVGCLVWAVVLDYQSYVSYKTYLDMVTTKFNYLDFMFFIQTGSLKLQTRSWLKLQNQNLILYPHLKLPFWISTSHRVWEEVRHWMYMIEVDQYVQQKVTLRALANLRCLVCWRQRLADAFVLNS